MKALDKFFPKIEPGVEPSPILLNSEATLRPVPEVEEDPAQDFYNQLLVPNAEELIQDPAPPVSPPPPVFPESIYTTPPRYGTQHGVHPLSSGTTQTEKPSETGHDTTPGRSSSI